MKTAILATVVVISCAAATLRAAEPASASAYLFSSFRGDGDGLHLAYSYDAHDWTDLGQVFLKPAVGGKLLRDPNILLGPDGVYRMVWTSGSKDTGIGYAYSKDLVSWSEQKYLPLMANTPGAQRCWAPQTFYDSKSNQYILIWSADVEKPGGDAQDRENDRIYYALTRDFAAFTKPQMLFDPGVNNSEATMLVSQGKYMLVFKEAGDQGKKISGGIGAAVANGPLGPYRLLPETIVANEQAEAPTPVTIAQKTLVYFEDAKHRYGARETGDWKTWRDVTSATNVVGGQGHGAIFTAPASLVEKLRSDAAAGVPKPILDGFTADPTIRVFGNRYYIYPTSDKPYWNTTEFAVWSSKNLVDWKKDGVILDVTKDLKWANLQAWAPDCVERNGTYYFYFCARGKIGVATAPSPTGPFKDALGRPLIQRGGKVTVNTIDPAVLIDDDGQAYLYFGNGNNGAEVFKLKPDMITLDGDPVHLQLRDFREGIFVFKRKGKYYFMWSIDDARSPNYRVGWGVSDSPFGPVKSPDKDFIVLQKHGRVVGTAHHSVVNVPGTDRWYVVYHRHAIPGGGGYKREVCLVRMEFNPDGSIKPMDPMTTPFKPGDVGEPLVNGKGMPDR